MNQVTYSFLPSPTIDWIYLNVVRDLPGSKRIATDTFWQRPIKIAIRVEQDPDSISSIILGRLNADGAEIEYKGTVIMHYCWTLVRVYLLLYYRHCGEQLYEDEVFPLLRQHMGIYGEPQLLQSINEKIEQRIKADKASNRYVTYHETRLAEAGNDSDDAAYDPAETQDVLANGVAFELFLKLLEGYEDDTFKVLQCNKSRVAELWQMMTGKSAERFRQYCSRRNYLNSFTHKDIERLNRKLAEIGIALRLPETA